MQRSATVWVMATVMATASFSVANHTDASASCDAARPAFGRVGQLYVSPGNHRPAWRFAGAAQPYVSPANHRPGC